jgi:hypothetical protein
MNSVAVVMIMNTILTLVVFCVTSYVVFWMHYSQLWFIGAIAFLVLTSQGVRTVK